MLYYLLKLLILGLLVQQMGIFVETLIRRIVIVMVDPSDTVYDVKAKIEDRRTLADYDIKGMHRLSTSFCTSRESSSRS